ncbi:unnamed protein product [Dicrocoelium dendriticum]|nr:unnamed protein product [Dicrocoelium dendriticum]
MSRHLLGLSRGLLAARVAVLNSVRQPMSIMSPLLTKCESSFITRSRRFSSQVDRQFTEVLSNEIKQEKENMYSCDPPAGFSVIKTEGAEVVLRKEYPDGVSVEVEINLAGSVNPEIDEADGEMSSEKKDEVPTLESRPDIRIRLTKPSGRSIVFNCSLPPRDLQQQQAESEDSNIPTYSVDSVEVERIPGYFVYTDLFDDNMYDHTMKLLMERQLDADFQNALQNFCTSEEHNLYLRFLNEFHAYCRD